MSPFTVHEAEIAVFHAWRDGLPVSGPVKRHLASGIIGSFRSGLKISESSRHELPPAFADWRATPARSGQRWAIETSAPLSALSDSGAPISSWLAPGSPLIVIVRFLCDLTGHWRFFQFTDAEVTDPESAESGEVMMTNWHFKAGWMDEFTGDSPTTLPPLEPRMRGVIEWSHLGRRIPCWYYDASSDTWDEDAQNITDPEGDPLRYVTISNDEGNISLSYLAALTTPSTSAGLDTFNVGWISARAFRVLESSGLTPDPGWVVQPGCPEPITIPPSGRHWEHPQVRFRFLGRLYATLAHGTFAVPSFHPDSTPAAVIDYPLRLGRLILLPDSAHVLPTPP